MRGLMTDALFVGPAAARCHLVVGESLIDLIRRPEEPDLARIGGSPLNVAVGLSRLGVPTALHTRIGSDQHGDRIAAHLDANGVVLLAGSVTSGSTSMAVAHIEGDLTRYEFDLTWELDHGVRVDPVLVHTGSVAAVLEPGASVVKHLIGVLRERATVSYDPNVRPQLFGGREDALRQVESFVALADIVKASAEDLEWLYPGQEPADVARRWLALGPALVVVTRGAQGALGVTAAATVSVPARPVEVVDTVGAGDSFMAGLLAALDEAGLVGPENKERLLRVAAAELEDALHFAARCSALTVARLGADPPTRDAVGARLPASERQVRDMRALQGRGAAVGPIKRLAGEQAARGTR